MKNLIFIALLTAASTTFQPAFGQSEGLLYGTITTYDNESFEGTIRWGKEEVFWTDIFNASKTENPNLRYLSAEQKEKLHSNTLSGYVDGPTVSTMRFLGFHSHAACGFSNDYTHQFSCRFGDIKKIKTRKGNQVEITMQNGAELDLNGSGFNDIGEEIQLFDKEIGALEIKWNRIAKIEFQKNPGKIPSGLGQPLYGTVETREAKFTGLIAWDKEERLGSDKLDGYTEDGKVAVDFEKIASIEKKTGKSLVKLKSGRELEIQGSNDVNGSNRGITVTLANGVAVTVPWREFSKLRLESIPSGFIPPYQNFAAQEPLKATVKTKEKSFSGKLVFDLDESFDFEHLQGESDELEYDIPFSTIRSITPISTKSAEVVLKNGEKLVLKGSQDVGPKNHGLLVFPESGRPDFVLWEELETIKF
jgi:hypothetical protein